MDGESPLRRWWPAVAAVTAALTGVLVLGIQIQRLDEGHGELAGLRAHGRHASAHATVSIDCSSGGRGGTSCATSSVWLEFTDATGEHVDEPEEPLDGSLYVPHGHPDTEGRVATTVVYDPSYPEKAQPERALDQGVLGLATHHWGALTIGLVLLGAGISGGVAAWPQRMRN